MLRRLPRSVYLILIFFLSLTTLNHLIGNENVHRNFVRQKIESMELKSLVQNPLVLLNARVYPEVDSYELKDWHDYNFMAYEANRTGRGENGTAVILTDPKEIKICDELREVEGLNVFVSDKISVNRSLPDVRHKSCRSKLYLKHLPHVSVIVIFHNEHPSLIQRTLHSIFNRSPRELLDEIILVNDASTKENLHETMENYIKENFEGKVKLVKLETRLGLIVARMKGAKKATSEVLVFLDSHIEVNVNWLPPLLEPIAMKPRTCTTPIIDQYSWLTWEYEVHAKNGVRGLFAWDFDYRMTAQKRQQPSQPKPTPIMLGCAFAINREYFWDLGAYDDQLLIWNAENYELSFKLWLCGGELLECPCSRVAHVFRRHNEFRKLDGVDFVGRNFKRIAEVWMDDWKQFLYKTDEERYANIDAGDLTEQKAVRERLNCKPFAYFLHFIAPEIISTMPIPKPDDKAYGVLKAFINSTNFCITDGKNKSETCSITDECGKSKIMPRKSQYFHFSKQRGLEHDRAEKCFENLKFHNQTEFEKNRWNYNFETNQIVFENGKLCVAADISTNNLTLTTCNVEDTNQRWTFGFVNASMS